MSMRLNSLPHDRLTAPLLWLMAALPFFLLLSLVLAVWLASIQPAIARSCRGGDLLPEIAESDPALFRRMRAEADATANADALLWRIEYGDSAPSYLFGTMHVSDPRVARLSPQAATAFDEARTVVIETTDVLDQKEMAKALFARPELTMFLGGEALTDHLSAAEQEILRGALDRLGVPFASIRRMKPWMLIPLAALSSCERARRDAGEKMLDIGLAEGAKAAGKTVAGLETMIEQMAALAALPMALHIEGLISALELGERIDDISETMIGLYLRGDTGMFWPFIRAIAPEAQGRPSGYAAFEQTMVIARNRVMAQRSVTLLRQGGAFIAVGALHLPGDDGLVAELRRAGFTITPVK